MKRWIGMAALSLAALLLVPLGACSARQDTGKVQTIKIGVTVYRKDDTFVTSLCAYLEQISKDKEIASGKKILVNIVDGQSNQALQNDQVDSFIAHDYNVVCVNEVDRTAAAVIVNKAKAAGMPLIFFNREPVEEDIRMWDKAYYVGADAAQSGQLQGEIAAEAWKNDPALDRNHDGKMQYVMLEGEQDHQDALLRTESSVKTITGAGVRVEKLGDEIANWQRAQGASRMLQWIDKLDGRIEVVLANNDDMALGAIDAIRESKLAQKPAVFGIDATQPGLKAVEDGSMTGTVLNDAKGQAQALFDICYYLATGSGEPAVVKQGDRYVRIPYRAVTKKNCEEILDSLRT